MHAPRDAVHADTGPLNISTHRIDGPMGRWIHSEARPARLSSIVDLMWHFEGMTDCLRERTFPNGAVEIIVHLGARYADVHGERVEVCPRTCLTGVQLGPAVVQAPGEPTIVLGIRLRAAAAYAVLGRPMHDLASATVDLRDAIGRDTTELEEACAGARTPAQCFASAARWIDGRLSRGVRPNPGIRWLADEIRRSGGALSIAAMRERAGLSSTRAALLFREQVGVTPKQYARIARFGVAMRSLSAGAASLAQAAADAGYYDQPHMTAEFKALAGLTPQALVASQRYPNSVHLAEQG